MTWRIEALLHWFDAADPVLASAIARPLARQEPGFGLPPSEPLD